MMAMLRCTLGEGFRRWRAGLSAWAVLLDAVVVEGFLDALGAGSSDALVDRECLPQVRGTLVGVAVPEMALADSF